MTVARHQEDKQSKVASSLISIKMIAKLIKALQACNIPTTGYFQCKENHFETKAITLYLFVEM